MTYNNLIYLSNYGGKKMEDYLEKAEHKCNQVRNELVSLALMSVTLEQAKEIETLARDVYKLKTMTSILPPAEITVWIYKYHHLRYVVEELSIAKDNLTVFQRWALCKALGADEARIQEILEILNEEGY
jgi:hypothetical protein